MTSTPPAHNRTDSGKRPDRVIHSVRIEIERKAFELTLRENRMGKFVRITEIVSGRHNIVIIPIDGANAFLAAVQELVKFEEKK